MNYTALAGPTIPNYFQLSAFVTLLTRTVLHAMAPAAPVMQKKVDSGTKKPTHYCYLHSHNNVYTHNGNNCFKMLANTTIYADAQLTATTLSMVPNGSTATPGEQRRNNRIPSVSIQHHRLLQCEERNCTILQFFTTHSKAGADTGSTLTLLRRSDSTMITNIYTDTLGVQLPSTHSFA